jgi:HAD superfamily phosphatase (TIGR01668 family)
LRGSRAGLSVCLVSNNWHDYVYRFAEELDLPIAGKALKPLPFGFLAGARLLGLTARECAVVGDQLFTDVLGGKLVGATTVLVVPTSTSDLPHTLVLRRIERVIMAGRTPDV